MKDNFDNCLRFTLAEEGPFTNDPEDPGGATNFGITLKTLEAFRFSSCTPEDVRRMSLEEAKTIYQRNYWETVKGDLLPAGVDLMTFDYGVNEGPRPSVRVLQDGLGVAADGIIGSHTLAALHRADAEALLERMADTQRAIYRTKATFARYGHGLLNRTDARLKAALAMVHQSAVG